MIFVTGVPIGFSASPIVRIGRGLVLTKYVLLLSNDGPFTPAAGIAPLITLIVIVVTPVPVIDSSVRQ